MSQKITIENATREQIAEFLSEAIALTVGSYREHMNRTINKDNFSEHHKQAKVAISHIELLIKLARWADLPDTQVAGDENAKYLQALMRKAEAEVEAYEEES